MVSSEQRLRVSLRRRADRRAPRVSRSVLDRFGARTVDPKIERQPRWTSGRSIEETYPIGADESLDEKTFIVKSWLVGDGTDAYDVLQLFVLSQVMLGHEGAPLRRALIESKLGQDLTWSGVSSVGLESEFMIGLKGSEPDRREAFEQKVDQMFRALADDTFAPELVETALQQASYHHLEIGQQYPLSMMNRVMGAWLYGSDPLEFVHMADHLDRLRADWKDDPSLFNKLLRERLVENPHSLSAVLRPDRDWQARHDASFGERMAAERARHDDADMQEIASEAGRLARQAGTPNTAEQVATLPQLAVTDLPDSPVHVGFDTEEFSGGGRLLIGREFTNGVVYLRLSLDLTGLPEELVRGFRGTSTQCGRWGPPARVSTRSRGERRAARGTSEPMCRRTGTSSIRARWCSRS